MQQVLKQEEVEFLQKRQRDDTGRVFSWNARIFRGIFPEQETFVRSMFTGFLDELISKEYFPETWITDYSLPPFSLILEHKKIWPVVYPQEWTFSMLKDAAQLVCRVGMVAKSHGFNMRDCHGLNVLYDGTTPKFIDLGSFIPDKWLGWKPYEEFLRFYYYPLRIWRYNSFVGKLSIFSGNLTTHETYWRYQHPLIRRMSPRIVDRLIGWYLRPEILGSQSRREKQSFSGANKLLFGMINKGLIRPKSVNLAKAITQIDSITKCETPTSWGTYHQGTSEKAGRFERIIEIVKCLEGTETALDLGGNQGKFSRKLIEETGMKRVVCIDSDENATDAGYREEKVTKTGKLTFVHFDFMGAIAKLRFMLPRERFEADLVIALALTHHLTLTQGYDIEDVFQNISSYAKKYVLIEFMPLGLWVKGGEVKTPGWYNIDWFRQAFVKYFDLVTIEELRENNVLFVGRVRQNCAQNNGE